jgi:mRNA interferase HicA
MRYREAARRLAALGCREIPRKGGGSHRKWLNPESGLGTILPDKGKKDLKMGTLMGAVKQLGIDWKRFIEM